ncbi:uncharacterized protein B0P05DRAFT_476539 [Gilbertella persicaria]|uniref:uncharacterized protein n=1 Tax=Gilbertella persicaria TaxID=101096 RepID=UPI0022209FF2|nr:uncharacterized protein B0P05DRAFT_476539 [Gilbertella persicaria]KAI8063641.1 hypothetical protein B0P05DRAFT_476539 [Gilbertella persicaria]
MVDLILWLPMTNQERSRLRVLNLFQRLGWLPHGHPSPYPLHPNQASNRTHAIDCFQMRNKL